MVNSSSLSDFQCYNESYDYTSSDICSLCNDIPVMLSLIPADENRSVSLTEDILEVVFKVPVQCSCSIVPSSSSLGDADEIAAVTLGVLVAVALTTTFVVVIFFYRERRKKS